MYNEMKILSDGIILIIFFISTKAGLFISAFTKFHNFVGRQPKNSGCLIVDIF